MTSSLCCVASDVTSERTGNPEKLRFTDYDDFSTEGLPGLLYVPPEAAQSDMLRPLILGLDGSGSVGSGNNRQFQNFGNVLAECKAQGNYLYLPQPVTAPWTVAGRPELIMARIDQLIAEEKIDPTRIYITGLSMGGGGVWDMLLLYRDRFAAAVIINGVTPVVWTWVDESGNFILNQQTVIDSGRLIKGIPVWAFHARDDTAVPAVISRAMMDILHFTVEATPPTYPPIDDRETELAYVDNDLNFRYTEYATGGHVIWNGIYQNPEIYDWLYSHALEPDSTMTWSGFPVNAKHVADTGAFMGPLYVEHAPMIYSYDLGSWLYLPLTLIRAEGGWAYIPR